MRKFVTFESLADGDFFFARDKFHCKGTIGLFQKPPDLVELIYNAFYFDGPIGNWSLFNEIALVQIYDESIHGQPPDIIHLQQAKAQA